MRDLGSRGLLVAAVVGIVGGLVGCTSGVTTLDGGYHGIGDRPVSLEPAPLGQIGRRLPSSGILKPTNMGWRMGPLYMDGALVDWLKGGNEKNRYYLGEDDVPWFFAWGYQFEYVSGPEDQTKSVVMVIPAIVGLDKSMFIPTVNVLVGLRSANNKFDIGAGPHFSPRETTDDAYKYDKVHLWGLGLTAGFSYTLGDETGMKIPLAVAVGWAADVTTYSVTIGWRVPEAW